MSEDDKADGMSFTDKVRHRAYALWMEDGGTSGRDHDYWFQAEQEITDEQKVSALPESSDAAVTPAAKI